MASQKSNPFAVKQTPRQNYMERDWKGVDAYHSDKDIQVGFVAVADNLLLDGMDWVTRRGFVGQFTTPLATPLYEPFAFVKADQSTEILFSSGGKLYKTLKGSASYTEILNGAVSFALASAGVRLTRHGSRVYGVDGVGPLLSYNGTTGASVTGLSAPTATGAASLTNTLLEPYNLFGWGSKITPNPVNLLLNPGFETAGAKPGTGGSQYAASWNDFGLDADCLNAAGLSIAAVHGGNWALLLNNAGEGVYQDVAAPTVTQVSGVVTTARVMLFQGWFYQKDTTAKSTAIIQIDALDNSATPQLLGRVVKELNFVTSVDWQSATVVASFTGLSVDPAKYRIRITAGSANALAGGVIVDDVVCEAADPTITSVTAGGLLVASATTSTNSPELSQSTWATGASWIVRQYRSDPAAPHDVTTGLGYKDFSLSNSLAAAITLPQAVGKPRFRFGFQSVNAVTIDWANPCLYSADGTYIYADISTVPLASRQKCQVFYVGLIDDLTPGAVSVTSTSVYGAFSTLFSLGSLVSGGNLSVGFADVTYLYTEQDQITATDIIESNGSPLATPLTPTGLNAEAALVLPVPLNVSTTHYAIYRYGGTFSDGFASQVAVVPINADATGPTWTWKFASRTFTDNTPDSALLFSAIYQPNRDAFPAGAQSLAVWQGRLWASAANHLYGSWQLADGQESGLYTSLTNNPADPTLSIKGCAFSVGDTRPITGLQPLGTALIVYKQDSIHLVTGYDPSNFAVHSYLIGSGAGTSPLRGYAKFGNHGYYLGPSGLDRFDGDIVDPQSVIIEHALSATAANGSVVIGAQGWAGIALCAHDRRLLIMAPQPGATTNTCIWVLDSRQGGYCRWLPPVALTGAVSLSSGADTNDLYFAGVDGQLYAYAGGVDKATPAATSAKITFAVQSRQYGQESGSIGYFTINRSGRILVDASFQETGVLNLTVTGDAAWTKAYQVSALTDIIGPLRVKTAASDEGLSVRLSGSFATQARMRAWLLETTEGNFR